MENMIEALQIMLTRGDVRYPFCCEHDELYIYPVDMDFTDAQFAHLEELGFLKTEDGSGFLKFV